MAIHTIYNIDIRDILTIYCGTANFATALYFMTRLENCDTEHISFLCTTLKGIDYCCQWR